MSKSMFEAKKFLMPDEPSTPFVLCANDGCPNCARIKVYHGNSFSNFCKPCYIKYHEQKCHEECRLMGLETRKQMIDYCIRGMRRLGLRGEA